MQRLTLVVFQCASQRFAVEARHVMAMGQLQQLMGEKIPLIELRDVLKLEQDDAVEVRAEQEFALQLSVQGEAVVLALDAEAQLVELTASSIWPLPPLMQYAKRHPSIVALALHNDHIISVLNVEHFAT